MTEGRPAISFGIVVRSLRLNALVLLFDLVLLIVYSLVWGVSFLDLILGGALGFLLLLEAGILLFVGGGYLVTSGISFGQVRERLFHSERWSPEEYRRSEVAATHIILAGALLLAESVLSSLV